MHRVKFKNLKQTNKQHRIIPQLEMKRFNEVLKINCLDHCTLPGLIISCQIYIQTLIQSVEKQRQRPYQSTH